MTTASMSGEARISSMVRTAQPYLAAISSAALGMASATATSFASGLEVIALACTLPMRPAPRSAKRMVMLEVLDDVFLGRTARTEFPPMAARTQSPGDDAVTNFGYEVIL